MISVNQPLTPKRPFDLFRCRFDIGAFPSPGRVKQQFASVSENRTVRDAGEAVEEQGAHITKRFKAFAVPKQQGPAQFFVPRHLVIIAQSSWRVQGTQAVQP